MLSDNPADSGEKNLTKLLIDWSNGDKEALDRITPLIYKELQILATRYMRRERAGHTLQTTALVHEAYLQLVDQNRVEWKNRAHFFGIAAQLMRRILIDHARKRQSIKRGGDVVKISFDEAAVVSDERADELVALDEALIRLARHDSLQSHLVELRFFGGLTVQETAEVMKITPAEVKREWAVAKAWLYRQLET